MPGIKYSRADLILAGALVIDTVMEAGGFGVWRPPTPACARASSSSTLFGDPPLVFDVREATVRNLAAQYGTDFAHAEHVVRLALELWDGLAAAGVHRGDPKERELLWAAAMLHDIGTAVDYDDHHKHSRYLILSAGMPATRRARSALIGQAVRYHRKGNPGLGEFSARRARRRRGAADRIAAAVRIAEQLERSRDQAVHACDIHVHDGRVELHLHASEDVTIARWATERQATSSARRSAAP